jgi:hypothetical protein
VFPRRILGTLARSEGFEPPALRFEDFIFDKERHVYTCPADKVLTTTGKLVNDGETKVIEHREDFDLTKQPPATTT